MTRPEGAHEGERPAGPARSVRLERLGPGHAADILAGQDRVLAQEVFGCRWEPAALAELLDRAQRWRPDGPVREFVARPPAAGAAIVSASVRTSGPMGEPAGGIVGGGGLHLLGPGLERGQADMSYWVLAPHRGHGWGGAIARALREAAAADPRIRALVLRIAPQNEASRRVASALGARSTGTSERHPGDAARRVERWELELDGRDGDDHDDRDDRNGGEREDPTTLAR